MCSVRVVPIPHPSSTLPPPIPILLCHDEQLYSCSFLRDVQDLQEDPRFIGAIILFPSCPSPPPPAPDPPSPSSFSSSSSSSSSSSYSSHLCGFCRQWRIFKTNIKTQWKRLTSRRRPHIPVRITLTTPGSPEAPWQARRQAESPPTPTVPPNIAQPARLCPQPCSTPPEHRQYLEEEREKRQARRVLPWCGGLL